MATKLSFFIFRQFRQIARKPYFWTPVPPINSYYKSFKYFPIKIPPLDLILFLEICRIFKSKQYLFKIYIDLWPRLLYERYKDYKWAVWFWKFLNMYYNPSSFIWLSTRWRCFILSGIKTEIFYNISSLIFALFS